MKKKSKITPSGFLRQPTRTNTAAPMTAPVCHGPAPVRGRHGNPFVTKPFLTRTSIKRNHFDLEKFYGFQTKKKLIFYGVQSSSEKGSSCSTNDTGGVCLLLISINSYFKTFRVSPALKWACEPTTVKTSAAFEGMVGGDPGTPYAKAGGILSLRFSPSHMLQVHSLSIFIPCWILNSLEQPSVPSGNHLSRSNCEFKGITLQTRIEFCATFKQSASVVNS